MKIKAGTFTLLTFLLLVAGCSYQLATLPLATSKDIRGQEISWSEATSTGKFEGKDEKPVILFFPLGFPHVQTAFDRALEKGKGDYMTDASIYYRWWYIPYVYGRYAFVVKGKVHRIEKR